MINIECLCCEEFINEHNKTLFTDGVDEKAGVFLLHTYFLFHEVLKKKLWPVSAQNKMPRTNTTVYLMF